MSQHTKVTLKRKKQRNNNRKTAKGTMNFSEDVTLYETRDAPFVTQLLQNAFALRLQGRYPNKIPLDSVTSTPLIM